MSETPKPTKSGGEMMPWLLGEAGVLMLMCCGGLGCGGVLLWQWGWQPAEARTTDKQGVMQIAKGQKVENHLVVEVAARELYDEYRSDLVAAESKYRGKRLRITDVPGRVEKDNAGNYFLTTLRQRVKRTAQLNFIPGMLDAIHIRIKPEDAGSFAGIKPSDTITVEGVCADTLRDPQTIPDVVVVIADGRRVQ
jgi:hypothetical protein